MPAGGVKCGRRKKIACPHYEGVYNSTEYGEASGEKMKRAAVFCALVLCGSAGRALGADNLNDQIRQQIEKLRAEQEKKKKKEEEQARKKARAETLKQLKEQLKKGEGAMKEENFSAAQSWFLAMQSCRIPGASRYTAKAKAHVLEIEDMARVKLNEAEVKHMLCEYVAEAEVLDGIINDFAHTKAARKARSKLSLLRREPKAASAIAHVKAKAEEDAENYGEAVRLYGEIVRLWPNEIAALKAEHAVRRLKSDPKIAELLKEHAEFEASKVCPGWINIAHNYRINADKDRAREYLQRVIDKFPDTSYAEEAEKKLKEL